MDVNAYVRSARRIAVVLRHLDIDDIVAVVIFDKEKVKAISSVSLQTVQFDPKPSNILYRVNRFELVNFIPDLQRVILAIHSNPSSMVENLSI